MAGRVSYNTFYNSWHEAMSELSDEQYGRLSRALNDYCFFGTESELTGVEKMLFIAIKPNIDSSVENKTAGQKGGAPKGNRNAKQNNPKQPPLNEKNNPPCKNETTYVEEDVYVEEKENNNFSVSVFEKQEEKPEPIHDKPVTSKEDATTVFNKARTLWNKLGLTQCRDLIMPGTRRDGCIHTLQNYSWFEIENAIDNYQFHVEGKFKSGEKWARPPPYGSLYGFLETGVARYFDDKAFVQQFREAGDGIPR